MNGTAELKVRPLRGRGQRPVGRNRLRGRCLGVLVAVVATLSTMQLHGQTASSFDREKLERLLKSDKVLELREAVQIIRVHPQPSMEFLPLLARRASHPELTDVFRWLVAQHTDPEQLKQIVPEAGSVHPLTLQLVQSTIELGGRSGARRPTSSPAMNASSQPRSPIAAASSSPRSAPTNTRPTTEPRPAPPFRRRTESPASPPPRPVIPQLNQPQRIAVADLRAEVDADEAPVMKLPLSDQASQLERLEALASVPADQPLGDDDWGYVFRALDQSFTVDRSTFGAARNSSISKILNLAKRVIKDHYATNRTLVHQFIVSPETSNPERVISLVGDLGRADEQAFEFVWKLGAVDDNELRTAALNHLHYSENAANQVVDELINRMSQDPSHVRAFVIPVFRVSQKADDNGRSKILAWQLEQFEPTFAVADQRQPMHRQNLEIVSQARTVVRNMSPQMQVRWVEPIVAQAEQSRHPRPYVDLLSTMKCAIGPAADLIAGVMNDQTQSVDRLNMARLLYRAAGSRSDVYPMFRKVIVQPRPEQAELNAALLGVIEVGEPASELVPDLVRLLREPAYSDSHSMILAAIRATGCGGRPAVTELVAVLSDPSKASLHREALETLQAVQPETDQVLELLLDIALDRDPKHQRGGSTRSRALGMIREMGPDAAEAADDLEPLANSDSHYAYAARAALAAIRPEALSP
ncbi:hypothetical protein FYK55_09120 [Roseiconus nitratireducens]|uniref:HEAT repeat protein n=1 Tax=Roseiconus nitratireducens TaxID=2605748 RepID=A0A5M6DDJ8_9BACT|nr:hypothetical protein [Roseiconus nitratireducens]KAA5544480.1 hypothetical protein FYK55_09120 [Roseiconus nitratireducens]